MTTRNKMRQLEGLADSAQETASYLQSHIFRGRVTHTAQALRKLINYVCQLNKNLKTNKVYARQFEKMLFQAQGGPLEVTVEDDVIYIQGIVKIDGLKEFFIVNEPPGFDAIEVLGPKK